MNAKTQSPPSHRGARTTLVGAIVAAVVASACCLGPAILAIVGISGVGFAAALAPYRPIFLGATALLLGIGFWLTYRKPKVAATGAASGGAAGDACGVEGCEMPRAARSGKIMLWMATVLVVVFAAYPYVAGAFAQKSANGPTPAPAATASATARIHIDGMSCEECTTQITRDLAKEKGVIKAEVDYKRGLATVTYDPAQVKPARFVEVIVALGYTATPEG